jgi:hypothetical protein
VTAVAAMATAMAGVAALAEKATATTVEMTATMATTADVRPTKVGNAIMTGIGSRQNPYTP